MKKILLLTFLAFSLIACDENEIAQSLLVDPDARFQLTQQNENCDDTSLIAEELNEAGKLIYKNMPFVSVLPTKTQSTFDMEVELTPENKFVVKAYELSIVENQIEKTLVEQASGIITEENVVFDDLCAEPLVFKIKIDK